MPADEQDQRVASALVELPEKAEDVLDVVERIPPGSVLTYGDVAELAGGRGPRFVGNVLSRFGSDVPWWRVVRAGGWPPRGLEVRAREHYREEGTPLVRGTLEGLRVDLGRARWDGRSPDPTAPRGQLRPL